jgi:hypothetical protein
VRRWRWRRGLVAAVAAAVAVAVAASFGGRAPVAGAARGDTGAFPPGAVVSVLGAPPHLWIADDQGVLHWASDTRALAGRVVDWGHRETLTAAQLSASTKGDPWLSAGLLRDGDALYIGKWEAGASRPELLRVQSVADTDLLGLHGSNYDALVLGRSQWEQAYGSPVEALPRGELDVAPAARERAGPLEKGDALHGRASPSNSAATASAPHRFDLLPVRGHLPVAAERFRPHRRGRAPGRGRLDRGQLRPAALHAAVLRVESGRLARAPRRLDVPAGGAPAGDRD